MTERKLNRYSDLREFIFTSESVGEGHPDKVADQISDALVDAYMAQDPYSRLAIETFVTTNRVIIGGEVRAPEMSKLQVEEIVRKTIKRIGYEQDGFDWRNVEIQNYIHKQSPDIARGVDNQGGASEGAGDQGIMFGHACRETEELMPAAIFYAHELLRNVFSDIHAGKLRGLGPDAKSQISLHYKGNRAIRAHNVVLSIQHEESISLEQVRAMILPYIEKTLPLGWMPGPKEIYINPTGKFVIGGPDGDAGLTGRKIIVDTYGGAAPHGGGAFSGKDPSKVDRSAAYMTRYLAKNVVAAGLADACTIQLAYAIGVAKPLALYVSTHGTSQGLKEEELAQKIMKHVDLTPWGLRHHLALHRPIYERTATYGHFGHKPEVDGGYSWEKTDLAEVLK